MYGTKELGNKSFVLEYALTSQKGEEIIVHATGTMTQIAFDMKARSTIEIPNWVRVSLTEFDQL